MIPLIEQILFLQNVSIFSDLSVDELSKIAAITKTEQYQEHEILFKRGDPGDRAYIVLSGTIEIFNQDAKGGIQRLTLLEKGSCFGEISLFDAGTRSASARTLETSVISNYGREDLLDVIQKHPAIAVRIIKELSVRIRELTEQMSHYDSIIFEFKQLAALLDSMEPEKRA